MYCTITGRINNQETGKADFFTLPLELSNINSLALSWTVVHPINEESPLWGMNEAEIRRARLEVLVHMRGFDDHFSNTVQQRTSYIAEELVYGAKFNTMYHRSEDDQYTIVQLNKINDFSPVPLPEPEMA